MLVVIMSSSLDDKVTDEWYRLKRVLLTCFSYSNKVRLGLWVFRYVSTLLLFGLGFLAPGIPLQTPLVNANSDQEVGLTSVFSEGHRFVVCILPYRQWLLCSDHRQCNVSHMQGFMQDKIIARHTCFGGHMDVNC